MTEATIILPGDPDYKSFYSAWKATKGDITAYGYTWIAVHEDTYVKFVRQYPVGGFDKHYGEQSWPQSGREIKKGPLDSL